MNPATYYREFSMDKQQQIELEAAAFRRLVSHLQGRTDVQNIDLMNLAGFCRNCLSKWYTEEAKDRNLDIELDEVRESVYGMPYAEWKAKYQQEATAEQKAAYAAGKPE
jgi:hypothetical protein